MDLNNHFKNFKNTENKIQNLKIEEFMNFFEIGSRDQLKSCSEYEDIEDSSLKKRIYNKVYYFEKKNKESSEVKVDPDIEEVFVAPQILTHKPKIQRIGLLYIAVIVSSLVFLMNESRLFYVSYGFNEFNSVLLPVLVEVSILLLALNKDIRSRLLMIGLILFNIVSFSFFTISEFNKNVLDISFKEKKISSLTLEKSRLHADYESVKNDLSSIRAVYEKALQNNYVTRAKKDYLPRMRELEEKVSAFSSRLEVINKNILDVKIRGSKEVLLVGAISLVFLKIILQLVTINFLNKFKSIGINLMENKETV